MSTTLQVERFGWRAALRVSGAANSNRRQRSQEGLATMLTRLQTTRTFVAQAIASAVICGLVNLAFLPAKSVSTTPRAVAQALQTKIGIWCSITFAIAWLSGGQPTGVMFVARTVRIST